MNQDGIRPLQQLVRLLASAVNTALLYSHDHQQVEQLLPALIDLIRRIQRSDREPTLVLAEDVILYQGKPLERDLQGGRLSAICRRQGIGYLRFGGGVGLSDLRQLLRVMVGVEKKSVLRERGAAVLVGEVDVPLDEGEARPIPAVAALSAEELKGLADCFEKVAGQEPLEMRQLTTVVAGFVTAFRREANPFLALAPLRMLDEYTFTHSVDVCILNLAQGMSLGIEGQLLHDLGIAGLLHDVGKMFVSREITQKAGPLDQSQWEQMKRHPSRGAQYLLNQPGIPRIAVFAAFEHHLRYDLQGYPAVPPNWRLNLASQMTMISDSFDALRTRRAYKDSWEFAKVSARLLAVAGTQLHPDLTMNFLRTMALHGEG